MKLLYVWLFIASGFVAHHVLALTFPAPAVAPNKGAGRGKRSGSSGPSNPTALALGGLLVLSMVLAGVLSYIRESQNHHVLYGVHEKDVRFQRIAWGQRASTTGLRVGGGGMCTLLFRGHTFSSACFLPLRIMCSYCIFIVHFFIIIIFFFGGERCSECAVCLRRGGGGSDAPTH